jgi:PAS domain S-box-containing protein
MDREQPRSVIDLAPVMLVRCDSEQRYLFANRAYTTCFDLTSSTIIGKAINEVHGEAAYSRIRAYIETVLSGTCVEFDVEVSYASVGPRWIHGVCEPEFDTDGRVQGFVGALEDVTTRVHAELALRKSEQRYRLLTEALPFMVWVMRPDLTLEYLNAQTSAFTGLSVAEVNQRGWARLVHPEDLPGMSATVSGPLERGEPHTVEYRFRRHDGEFRWVQSSAYPLKDDAGTILQWIGATQDIHDRRQHEHRLRESENRFRQLADAIPQIVWMSDSQGRTDFHNERWYEYTGLSSSLSQADDWRSVVHPEDGLRVNAAWEVAAQNGEPFEEEVRIRHVTGGDYRWFLTRAIPIRDAKGRPLRYRRSKANRTATPGQRSNLSSDRRIHRLRDLDQRCRREDHVRQSFVSALDRPDVTRLLRIQLAPARRRRAYRDVVAGVRPSTRPLGHRVLHPQDGWSAASHSLARSTGRR